MQIGVNWCKLVNIDANSGKLMQTDAHLGKLIKTKFIWNETRQSYDKRTKNKFQVSIEEDRKTQPELARMEW